MARNIYTGANTPPSKKRAFAAARAEGMTVSAASRTAKISRDLGYALEKQLADERTAREERRRGRTVGSAAGMGLSGLSTSRQTMAGGRAGHGNPWANDYATLTGDDLPGPVPVEDLAEAAAASLQDFALFRRRYLGRGPSPWQEDAGQRLADLLIAAQENQTREYVVVNAPPGGGKALALDTPIATPSGWSTMKDLRPGDEVFDDRGHPTIVVAKSEVFYGHDCFVVESDDGASVVADADHLWPVRLHGHGQYGTWKRKADYAGKTGPKPSADGRHNHTTRFLAQPRSKRAQLAPPPVLATPGADLPVDPYTLGVWLGDGHSSGARITLHPDDAAHVVPHIEAAGFTVTQRGPMSWSVTGSARWTRDGLTSALRRAGLLNNKHVPPEYLRAAPAQRLALLQGLIDTDGWVAETGRVEFTSTSRRLAEGVWELAHSLGVKASLRTGRASLNGKDCGEKYRVGFYLAEAARLPRKAQWCRRGLRTTSRYLRVRPTLSVPTQCIQVAAESGCYLAGRGLLVTHNSTLFTHDLVCWLICRDRRIRVLIGSRTSGQAMKYTQRVRSTLQQRALFAPKEQDVRLGKATEPVAIMSEDFGRFKPSGRGEVWQKGGFTVAQFDGEATGEKEPTVTAFGFDSDYLGMRVDLAIWDDLVDKDNFRNLDVIENLQDDWDGVAENRIDPGGLLVLQGQRLQHNDLYRYCLDKKTVPDEEDEDAADELVPKYRHVLYRAHDESNCQGLHKRADPPWQPDGRGGCLLDPRRLPWSGKDGLRTKMEMEPDVYRVVFQQEDLDPESALIHKAWVDGGFDQSSKTSHIGCWDADRSMWQRPAGLTPPFHLVVSVDPSPSNWWAMQLWAYEPATERRYLIAVDRRRMDSNEFIDWDLDRHKPTGFLEEWWQKAEEVGLGWRTCILEVNTAQKWLDQSNAATRWKVLRGVTVMRHTTGPNKTDKDLGIRSVRNHWRTGRIRLPGKPDGSKQAALLLVNEMLRWPNGTTDDEVMAHWFVEFNLPRIAPRCAGRAGIQRRPSWLGQGGKGLPDGWARVFASKGA